MKFDKSKIAQFRAEYGELMKLSGEEYQKGYVAFQKKWSIYSYGQIPGWGSKGPWLPLAHWIYTLRAHSRGRIHATKIGRTHEKGVYCHTISTLEQQEAFSGKFLAQFKLPELDAPAQVVA